MDIVVIIITGDKNNLIYRGSGINHRKYITENRLINYFH